MNITLNELTEALKEAQPLVRAYSDQQSRPGKIADPRRTANQVMEFIRRNSGIDGEYLQAKTASTDDPELCAMIKLTALMDRPIVKSDDVLKIVEPLGVGPVMVRVLQWFDKRYPARNPS